ncbi:Os04g0326300 [Oryza sativa Japonica Group]|uniref:Os04g0326300 protein n=1 Tax=Oryza sativa subsp. japonica TaxID=39947 RepID=A0A0P0W8X6_ORYSJ|nr:hypothetical protein EE612_023157 [Oryza sativa]BAS88599.1 Os04g0326300 [Oryza sativa Japonica Group]
METKLILHTGKLVDSHLHNRRKLSVQPHVQVFSQD